MRLGLTLFVILAGFPAGLVALAGSPLPSRTPTSADLESWFADPTAPQFLPGLLAALAWLFWALAAAVSIRLAAARCARRLSRFVQLLPGPLQGLAATILGAAAVTAAYSPASAATTDVPLPPRLDPDEVFDRAATSGDAHAIKFADAAIEAWHAGPDPTLLLAAVHATNLIGPA